MFHVQTVNRTSIGEYERQQLASFGAIPVLREYAFNTLVPLTSLSDPVVVGELVDVLLHVLNNPTVDSNYYCGIGLMGGKCVSPFL